MAADSADLRARLAERTAAWRVDVDHVTETETSMLAFGRRDNLPVVMKIAKSAADEWCAGEVLEAFGGSGVVRVYDHTSGAILMERLNPAQPLSTVTLGGDDDAATATLAETIAAMTPGPPPAAVPTAADWGKSFERYVESGDASIPVHLVQLAHRMYPQLCASQTRVRLIHGDLHHDNVLFDERRGWVAVDPKGRIAEIEFEAGAALRNPYERPDVFADAAIVRKRIQIFSGVLGLDRDRVRAWAFVQAVLAAIWAIEDGEQIPPDHGWLTLAETIQS